jgi:hypothetical protein
LKMRLSKAFWIAALAVLVCQTPTAFAQGTPPAAEKKTTADAKPAAAKPGDKTAAAPAAAAPADAAKADAAKTDAAKPAEAAKPADAKAAPAAAAATPTAPAATAAATTEGGTTMDGSTYVVRLRDLEQRIDELKEQIRRSHTRLSLLSDTILSGGVGGARAEITFKNDLSNAFRLAGATFVLDGAVQYNKQDDSENSALSTQKEIPVFSGSIPPGDHTLQIVLRLRGHGYGVFSYLRGYKFQVPSSHSFTITEGKTLKLDVIAYEKGDVTTALEQRPAIRYLENVRAGVSGGGATPAEPAAAPGKVNASGGVSIGTGAK